MGFYSKELKYRRLTDKWVILTEDLTFNFTLGLVLRGCDKELRELLSITGFSDADMIRVVAPKGFITDLASVPPALRWLFRPDGPWADAAVTHDMIYQALKGKLTGVDISLPIVALNANHTQLLADRIFLAGMKAVGVDPISRRLLYSAVRAFGSSSYGGKPMLEDYGIENLMRGSPRSDCYMVFRTDTEVGVLDAIQNLHTDDFPFHAVKYPNLKRAFVYDTIPFTNVLTE